MFARSSSLADPSPRSTVFAQGIHSCFSAIQEFKALADDGRISIQLCTHTHTVDTEEGWQLLDNKVI